MGAKAATASDVPRVGTQCGADDALARLRQRRCGVAYRARAAVAILLLLPSATGCYHYVSISDDASVAGTEVSIEITDPGRVALTSQFGPGVRRLHGRLTQWSDSLFVIGLTTVEYLGLRSSVAWAGESVSVSRNYVAGIQERRFARTRSWLTVGVLVLLAAVSTFVIADFGGDPGSDGPGGGGGDQ